MKKGFFIVYILCLFTGGCKSDDNKSIFYSETEQTLLNYMTAQKANYSAFMTVLETSGYDKIFGTYGNYTLFAFTNQGWDNYLLKVGKNSVSDFTSDELKDLVKSHTINTGRVFSENFKSGNLDQINLLRDNLVCRFGAGNEIFINSNKVVIRDLELLNGVLFQLDGVIEPVKESVGEIITSMPSGYTIFKQALTQTGLMAKIEKLSEGGFTTNYTVLLCPDEIYRAAGISTYSDLVAFINQSNGETVTDHSSLFYNYVARHIIPKTVFLNRFGSELYPTLGNVFLDVIVGQSFVINPDSPSPASLKFTEGNFNAKNGVCHVLTSMLDLSSVAAKKQFFDFSDQPELTDWKQLNAGAWGREQEEYSGVSRYSRIRTNSTQFFYYHSPGGAYNDLHNQDGMFTKSGSWYMDFDLPALPIGKYELWVHVLKAHNAGAAVQCYWDGMKVGRIFGMQPDNDKTVGGVKVYRWGPLGGNYIHEALVSGRTTVMLMYLGNINVTGNHIFGVKTVVDGLMIADRLEFRPIIEATE